MTKRTTIVIVVGAMVLFTVVALALVGRGFVDPNVSAVPIPNSTMTVVVRAELAGCYDC